MNYSEKKLNWILCELFPNTDNQFSPQIPRFLILQHQLGIQQFNPILILPGISPDPAVKGSVPEYCLHFRLQLQAPGLHATSISV